MNIKLTRSELNKVMNPIEVYGIMQRILLRESRVDRTREHFWVISLNTAHKILNIELVSMGSINKTIAEPMEVFSIPLQKRANGIILVHNHPSGSLIPSAADKDLTDLFIQCGRMLHVNVVDHFIISTKAFYSFAQAGLLEELGESLKYVPQFKIKEKIAKERADGENRGREEKARAMAKAMKNKGEPISKILEYTGLTRHVISRLK